MMELTDYEVNFMTKSSMACVVCKNEVEQGKIGRMSCGCFVHSGYCLQEHAKNKHSCSTQFKLQVLEEFLKKRFLHGSLLARYWSCFKTKYPKMYDLLIGKVKDYVPYNSAELHLLREIWNICYLCETEIDASTAGSMSYLTCCGCMRHTVGHCPADRVRRHLLHCCGQWGVDHTIVKNYLKKRLLGDSIGKAYLDIMRVNCANLLSVLPRRLNVDAVVELRNAAGSSKKVLERNGELENLLDITKKESQLNANKVATLTRELRELKMKSGAHLDDENFEKVKATNVGLGTDDATILGGAWDQSRSLFSEVQAHITQLLEQNVETRNRDQIRVNNRRVDSLIEVSEEAKCQLLDCIKITTSLLQTGIQHGLSDSLPAQPSVTHDSHLLD